MHKGVRLVFYRTLYSQSAASITMGSLAACLRERGHPVKICLLERGAVDTPIHLVRDAREYPIIIAKPNFKDHQELMPLLAAAKITGAATHVFLCGPFASMNADDIMRKHQWLDGIAYGYPEDTFVELLEGEQPHHCTGGVWRDAKGIHDLGKREPRSMDDLPPPARDIERMENAAYANIEASRGCLFNCSFCHVPIYHGQSGGSRRAVRSASSVVDEMASLKEMGKTLFIFNDPMFWTGPGDTSRIREICETIIARDLDVHFYVYLRCNPFPPEDLLDLMVRAGLVRVFLGVENAAQGSLISFKKMITPPMADHAWRVLQDKGVNVHLGFIVFEPHSSIMDIRQNIAYLAGTRKLCRIGVLIEPPRIVPMSGLLKQLSEEGLYTGTGYADMTYAYAWTHPETGALFRSTRRFFQEHPDSYAVEYHCVSGMLLRTIAIRTSPTQVRAIEAAAKGFSEMYDETSRLVERIMMAGLDACGRDDCYAAMEKHAQEFAEHAARLAIAWGTFVNDVRALCGDRPMREVFTGKEGIE